MTALANRERLARALRGLDPDRPIGRKTAIVRKARRPLHQMPDYALSIELPLGHSLRQGEPTGVIGAEVVANGRVAILGKRKELVLGQGKKLARLMGISLEGTLTRIGGSCRCVRLPANGDWYYERVGNVCAVRTLFD